MIHLSSFMQSLLDNTSDTSHQLINCSDLFSETVNYTLNYTLDDNYRNLQTLRFYLYGIMIPVVCVFGFFGNILNIAVFTKKKTCKTLDEIEYCTTICLVALAVSDMMFCFCTFPQMFQKDEEYYTRLEFILYYTMYSSFAINTFILSSTVLTVLTAIMRYTAICHPFYSRQFISLKKTIVAILCVFGFSFAFNLPFLWTYNPRTMNVLVQQVMSLLTKVTYSTTQVSCTPTNFSGPYWATSFRLQYSCIAIFALSRPFIRARSSAYFTVETTPAVYQLTKGSILLL